MATKGHITVVGMDREGRFIVEATREGMEVLIDARRRNLSVRVEGTVPTRGKHARAQKHTLRITQQEPRDE